MLVIGQLATTLGQREHEKGTSLKKMGRPRIEIDQVQFEKLCAILCTLDDIAGFFNCSPDTIENWCKRIFKETFSDIYKKKSAKGKISLRRTQYEVAMKGNVSMLIWLGKQVLGQKDSFDPPTPIQVIGDNTKIVYESEWGGSGESTPPMGKSDAEGEPV